LQALWHGWVRSCGVPAVHVILPPVSLQLAWGGIQHQTSYRWYCSSGYVVLPHWQYLSSVEQVSPHLKLITSSQPSHASTCGGRDVGSTSSTSSMVTLSMLYICWVAKVLGFCLKIHNIIIIYCSAWPKLNTLFSSDIPEYLFLILILIQKALYFPEEKSFKKIHFTNIYIYISI
jgi:hypothetical protein